MSGGSHRAGPLKQTNKSHKTGSHRSKGAAAVKGKLSSKKKVLSSAKQRKLGRIERRHRDKQIRDNKRSLANEEKRGIGKEVPILVVIFNIGFIAGKDVHLVDKIHNIASNGEVESELSVQRDPFNGLHVASSRLKKRLTFISASSSSLSLDGCRVSDACLLLLSVHDVATLTLDSASLQQLHALLTLSSSPTIILRDLDDLPAKKHNEMRKSAESIFEKMGVNVNVVNEPKDIQGLNLLLRHLSQSVRDDRKSRLRHLRPYLVAESLEVNESDKELKISGYVRGVNGFNVNRLVHIPCLGSTFQLDRIEVHGSDPHPIIVSNKRRDVDMREEDKEIIRSEPALIDTLDMENEPDMFDGEQMLSPEDEMAIKTNENKKNGKKTRVVRVPKGTSEYQAAWLIHGDDEEDEGEDSDSENDDDMDEDGQEMIPIKNDEDEDDHEEYETLTIGSTIGDEDVDTMAYDSKLDIEEERKALKEKQDAATMDALFPDEMDTPVDQQARIRFQKYRGLQSFKNSQWDPKENLPSDYARIFQFESFERTRKRVFKSLMSDNTKGTEDEKSNEVKRGSFVTLVMKDCNENSESLKRAIHDRSLNVIVFGMLEHENRMSLVHFVVKHLNPSSSMIDEDEGNVIATSKERLTFYCGYRRFAGNPIFSEHSSGDKHKYLRFWHPNQSVIVMSMFAPIQFPPCPVLVFRDNKLIATGNLMSVDPDRRIIKRVLLSGHPFKVYRRSSTVRFMFFNREDIQWFKPVELKTKRGMRGHIREPLGTHGHMKCVFNKQISQQDTVLLPLYKRVFPKWTFETVINSEDINNDTDDHQMMEVAETLQLTRK